MWAFVSARLRQWILLAVLVPIAISVIHLVRTELEKKQGQTPLVKGLKTVEEFGQRHRRDKRGRDARARDDSDR